MTVDSLYAHSESSLENCGTREQQQSLKLLGSGMLALIGAAIVLGSLYYMTQSLNQTVSEPPLEVDMATSPLDPKDLIDDRAKWLQATREAKPNANVTPQEFLDSELLKLRRDYAPHPPAIYGSGGKLMGPDPIYRGDYNDYDFVNRET